MSLPIIDLSITGKTISNLLSDTNSGITENPSGEVTALNVNTIIRNIIYSIPLGGIANTNISSPVSGDFLQYNGSKWINKTLAENFSLSGLSDVTINNPTEGQMLIYSGGTQQWINVDGYTKVQINSNFLSANTSYYTQSQSNANFLSANTSYYTRAQSDANYLSANTAIISSYGFVDTGTTQAISGIKNFTGGISVTGLTVNGKSMDSGNWLSANTSYYTQAQTNANFLSANTSYYTQAQSNANFLSATTNWDNRYLSATTSYYTQAQANANFLSANTNSFGQLKVAGLLVSGGTSQIVMSGTTNTISLNGISSTYNKIYFYGLTNEISTGWDTGSGYGMNLTIFTSSGSSSSPGYNGGDLSISSGNGGNASNSIYAGGNSGTISITAGNGGNSTSPTGGTGGSITLHAGDAGTPTGIAAMAAGGNVNVLLGLGHGTTGNDGGSFMVKDGNNSILFYTQYGNPGQNNFYINNLPTTASAANLYIDPTFKVLMRVVSSLKYKEDIQDIINDDYNDIYNLRPISYKPKNFIPKYSGETVPYSYGFIAEEVDLINKKLVDYMNGEPDGVHYTTIIPLIVGAMKDLKSQIESKPKVTDRGSVSAYDFNIDLSGITTWQTLDVSSIIPTGYTYIIMLAGLTTNSNGSGGQVSFSQISGDTQFNVDIIKVNTAATTDYQTITVATNDGKILYIPSGDLENMTIVVRGWM